MDRRDSIRERSASSAMARSKRDLRLRKTVETAPGHKPAWLLKGTYFEACSCETVCPCIFQSAPSHGDCSVIYAWQIDAGTFGATDISGFNIALAAYAGGHMQKVKWRAALYIDERANKEQRHALETIFTGKAGGFLETLTCFFERFSGVKFVAIHYLLDGKKRAVSIPNILDASIHAIKGQNDDDTVVSGHPLSLAPGNPFIVAQSDGVHLEDYEWKWSFSGRAARYSPFQYQSV